MSTPYITANLDTTTWDLTIDGAGNIATSKNEYAAAQDTASACLTFYGECYYDNTLGIPWDVNILGKPPSGSYIAQKMEAEAKKLPIVDEALCAVYYDRSTRQTKGSLKITTKNGDEVQLTI